MITNLINTLSSRNINTCLKKNNPIVICGLPRSGTTWLAEAIRDYMGAYLLWEPLDGLARHEYRMAVKFDERVPLNEVKLSNQILQSSINKFMSGCFVPLDSTRREGYRRDLLNLKLMRTLFTPNRVLIKLIRGNLLLGWLIKKYDVKAVLLIRHPCAVVSSQMSMAWEGAEKWGNRFIDVVTSEIPEWLPVMKKLKTAEEVLAFDWCLLNKIAAIEYDQKRCKVVFYEDLIENYRDTLLDIIHHFDDQFNINECQIHNKLSSTHQKDGDVGIVKWKNKLSKEQIERILDVCIACDMLWYTDDGNPKESTRKIFA